jgi:hypothetical protein
MFPFTKERRHPAVIISNDETCQNSDSEEVKAALHIGKRQKDGGKNMGITRGRSEVKEREGSGAH